jgi:hypothetical protein
MTHRYVRREPRSTIWVAFCRENGPCDHVWHDQVTARECADLLSTGSHWHSVKEASRISGHVFDLRPMHPAKTADGERGKIGVHPMTGEPCR